MCPSRFTGEDSIFDPIWPLRIQSHAIWPEECSKRFPEAYAATLAGVNPDDGASFVIAYIDDLLVFSSSLQRHMEHLYQVI